MGYHFCTEDDLANLNEDDDGTTRTKFEDNYEKYICLDEPEKMDLYGNNGSNSTDYAEFQFIVLAC